MLFSSGHGTADLGYERLSGRLEVSKKMKWAGTLIRESESLGASRGVRSSMQDKHWLAGRQGEGSGVRTVA